MTKVYIASSRDIGKDCKKWAIDNMPDKFQLTEDMANCDIFISVLYDKLITKDFIDNKKCFNFHPGILPNYRGAGCSSWAIINCEIESGITLHYIDEGIDTGDIIKIVKFPINPTDTAYDVNNVALKTMFQMFKDNLEILLKGNITSIPQGKGTTYYRKDLDNAKDLTRFVNAFSFPGKEGSYYIKDNTKIYIGEKI